MNFAIIAFGCILGAEGVALSGLAGGVISGCGLWLVAAGVLMQAAEDARRRP